MIAYAKILDENTKIASVGLGTDASYYTSIGMTPMDVEQGYDGSWYLAGYAPEKPAEVIAQESKESLLSQLNQLDLQSIRAMRAIQAGTATEFDTQKLAKLEERAEQIRQEIRDLSEVKLDNQEEID